MEWDAVTDRVRAQRAGLRVPRHGGLSASAAGLAGRARRRAGRRACAGRALSAQPWGVRDPPRRCRGGDRGHGTGAGGLPEARRGVHAGHSVGRARRRPGTRRTAGPVEYADLAMAEFRKAAELPTHAESLVRIATAYAAAGQPDRAEPVLRHVVDTLRGQATPWLAEAERILASLPPVGRD